MFFSFLTFVVHPNTLSDGSLKYPLSLTGNDALSNILGDGICGIGYHIHAL